DKDAEQARQTGPGVAERGTTVEVLFVDVVAVGLEAKVAAHDPREVIAHPVGELGIEATGSVAARRDTAADAKPEFIAITRHTIDARQRRRSQRDHTRGGAGTKGKGNDLATHTRVPRGVRIDREEAIGRIAAPQ